MQADVALPPYPLAELVGDLPDPPADRYTHRALSKLGDKDPYRRIPGADYMMRLAGREPNRAGFVRCPNPAHTDEHPSCSVRGPHPELWHCQACGAGGSIYDLAPRGVRRASMSAPSNDAGARRVVPREGLFVVHVCDSRASARANHEGGEYTSPPQDHDRALELVGLLLGRPAEPQDEREHHWRLPIAGGQRTATLRRAVPGRASR
jgi:hypothetical protein